MGYTGTKEERYEKNRAAQVKYLSDPEKKRAHAVRVADRNRRYDEEVSAFVQEAKSGPCLDCGKRYPFYVMDFDHVRGEKINNISRMASNRRKLVDIKAEIEKCDLVCSNCHRVRSWIRMQDQRPVAQFG